MRHILNAAAQAGLVALGMAAAPACGNVASIPGPVPEAAPKQLAIKAAPESKLSQCLQHTIEIRTPGAPYEAQRVTYGGETVRDTFSAIAHRGDIEGGIIATIDHRSADPSNLVLTVFARDNKRPAL